MTKILIEPGTTPTGYGMKQRGNGTLRPISPCCGRSMEYTTRGICKCRGCENTYDENAVGGALGNDIDVTLVSFVNVQRWVRNILGDPGAEITVTK